MAKELTAMIGIAAKPGNRRGARTAGSLPSGQRCSS
jgi:hypothetical protein